MTMTKQVAGKKVAGKKATKTTPVPRGLGAATISVIVEAMHAIESAAGKYAAIAVALKKEGVHGADVRPGGAYRDAVLNAIYAGWGKEAEVLRATPSDKLAKAEQDKKRAQAISANKYAYDTANRLDIAWNEVKPKAPRVQGGDDDDAGDAGADPVTKLRAWVGTTTALRDTLRECDGVELPGFDMAAFIAHIDKALACIPAAPKRGKAGPRK
jgi:hypothetical protein